MGPSTEPIHVRLARCLREGHMLDLLSPPFELDTETMLGWGAGQVVDAKLIRDLILGRHTDGDADPRGLHLRGARIRGRLDLDFVESSIALRLQDCLLEEGVTVRHAHLPTLELEGC